MIVMGVVVGGLQAAGYAQGTTDKEAALAGSSEAFEVQDYDRVIELLRPLLASDALKGDARRHVSLERLAASYWFTDALDAARLTFATLLKETPDYALDPLYYPQELITFFSTEKQRLLDLGFIGAPPQDTVEKPGRRLRVVKTVTKRAMPTIGYLMPFAVGQFSNEDEGKGTLLAVLQGIGLATNIAAWIAIEAMKKKGTNLVSVSDSGRAEVTSILWWIGTSLFAGSYVYSVVDGFVFRPPEESVERGVELEPPRTSSGNTRGLELRLSPSPLGTGLGLQGSF